MKHLILLLFLSSMVFAQNKICEERGHIWQTISAELAYYHPQIIDLPGKTIEINCYNGETQVCKRCGETRRYKPPCDTTVIWRRYTMSDTLIFRLKVVPDTMTIYGIKHLEQ